ncbi:hypothetical protein ES703_77076 [subsurface metagenome]
MPNGRKPQGRKVWSIDLELVWLPFFSATNVMGDTALPLDAIGAPLRLGYAPDGSVKFSKAGRPIMKVAKELSEAVRLVRENFTATLVDYAGSVIKAKGNAYRELVSRSAQAGQPIIAHDRSELDKAIARQVENAMADAQPEPEPTPVPHKDTAKPVKELVTA